MLGNMPINLGNIVLKNGPRVHHIGVQESISQVQAVANDLAQAMSSKAKLEETPRRTNGELACL